MALGHFRFPTAIGRVDFRAHRSDVRAALRKVLQQWILVHNQRILVPELAMEVNTSELVLALYRGRKTQMQKKPRSAHAATSRGAARFRSRRKVEWHLLSGDDLKRPGATLINLILAAA